MGTMTKCYEVIDKKQYYRLNWG